MEFKWKEFYFIGKFGTVNTKNDDKTIKKLMQICSKFEKKNIFLQAIQSWPIVSERQVKLAFLLAVEAVLSKTNYAKKISLELMLKLFAKRQIKELSWQKLGIQKSPNIFLFGIGKNKALLRKAINALEKLLCFKPKRHARNAKYYKKIAEFYSISKELPILQKRFKKWDAIENAIMEKMALAAIGK